MEGKLKLESVLSVGDSMETLIGDEGGASGTPKDMH